MRPRSPRVRSSLLLFGCLLVGSGPAANAESRVLQPVEAPRARAGSSGAGLDSIGTATPGAGFDPWLGEAAGSGVLGRIEIPRLGITATVAEGTDAETLRRAVGHIPSTARPGSPGNCALAGHRDTHLRGLGGVRVNDVIRIITLARTYLYQVEWGVVVRPQRVDMLDSTATRSLTLVTCFPFQFVGSAPLRFVVRAREVEAVAGK